MSKKADPTGHKVRGVQMDSASEKDVVWWPPDLPQLIRREWPEETRKEVGFQLGRVQQGLDPDHYRDMSSIGVGVREIKVQDENKSQYRLIYIARFEEAIYVIHIITRKTTQKTRRLDIEIAKKRLREIIEYRKRREGAK
jgi:phage-related protein